MMAKIYEIESVDIVESSDSENIICVIEWEKSKGSKKVSSKFEVYKFLVSSEILGHNFNPPILNYTNREF
jgi:hypothetical protein